MKHTSNTTLVRVAIPTFLLFGTALITSAHGALYLGQLVADSSVVPMLPGLLQPAAPNNAAATELIEYQLGLGMIIVIVGCALHLLYRRIHSTKKKIVVRPAFSMK